MDNIIDLNRNVYDKNTYTKNINTQFTELGVKSINDELANNITVDDFFNYYNQLFYSIPKNGTINSHEYLVTTSGNYINFSQNNEQIIALQKEISSLREENLQLNVQIIEYQTGQKISLTGSLAI
jgi:hypothetical protein